MTVATTTNRFSYAGNGTTTAFAYSSKFLANGDLVVLEVNNSTKAITTKTLTTHYTVTGAGDANGGTVTMLVAPASGTTLVIYGAPAATQGVDLVNGEDLAPDAGIETPLDRVTLLTQRLGSRVDRAVRLADGDISGASTVMPVVTAGAYFRWNVGGDAIEFVSADPTEGAATFQQSGTGAVSRTWTAKAGDAVAPEDFGAVGGGVVNDATAVLNALQSGRVVDGNGRTYGISGNLQPSSFKGLRNIKLIQLAPGSVGVKTLSIIDQNDWFLDNVSVDCGADLDTGNMDNNAGIWVNTSSGTSKRFWMRNVEVKNGGPMNGIAIQNSSEFSLVSCVVKDFTYNLSPDPTDDKIQGIWLSVCSNFIVVNTRIQNLTGFLLSVASKRFTRGFTFGGCTQFVVGDCLVDGADQGYDLTGTTGNEQFAISNCVAADCGTEGFKFANSAHHGTVSNCIASDCGRHGFHVSGMTDALNPLVRDITFSNCLAWNTGSNGIWLTERRAFFVEADAAVDTSYPRGIKFIGCDAIDTQASVTTDHGFVNDVTAILPTSSGYNADHTNRVINCWSRGPTTFQSGFHFPVCSLTDDDAQSIPNDTWTALTWDTETFDSSNLHSTAANTQNVYVKEAGYYEAVAHIAFDVNATGERRVGILLNGTIFAIDVKPGHATINPQGRTSGVTYCVPGDAIRAEAYQNSGGSLDVFRQSSLFYVKKIA